MAKKKHHSNHAAKHVPHSASPKGRLLQRKKYFTVALYVLSGVILVGSYALLLTQSPVISYQFSDESTAQEWAVQGKVQRQLTPNGLLVRPQGTALLISPQLQSPAATISLYWRNFPYVKLRVVPQAKERRIALVWIPGQDLKQNYQLPFTIPAMASEILLDTRQDVPWERRFGWNKDTFSQLPLRRIGLLVQDTIQIKEIQLLSSLHPLEFGRLLWSQYWAVEPVKVSSINVHYGNEVLGTSLVVASGTIFIIMFIMMLIIRQRKFQLLLLWMMLLCFALPSMPFISTLWNQAKASSKISAWHDNRYDEYSSRFSQEFADLDREFQKHVPAGTSVAFPDSKQWLVQGESNWIWFLYYGLYEDYQNRNRDSAHLNKKTEYIFYYYPKKLLHDEENNLLQRTEGEKTYKTQTIARISKEAKILKLIHD